MKTEKISVEYRCDWCGAEIVKPTNSVSLVHSWASHDGANRQYVSLGGSIYYGTTQPDYCKECAIKALKEAISVLEE